MNSKLIEAAAAPIAADKIGLPNSAKPPFAASRTRPLYAWPDWPHYKSGDIAAAASFECRP
jgi:hypothetical protein